MAQVSIGRMPILLPTNMVKILEGARGGTGSRFLTRDPVAFDPVTRPDPTRSLSIVKQILDNDFIAVSVTCQETQTV